MDGASPITTHSPCHNPDALVRRRHLKFIGNAELPVDPTLQWLRQQAERARRYARHLVGDEAEGRLQEFARQMDEKAALLSAKPDANIETKSDHSHRSKITMPDDQPADPNERENRIRERAYHLWEAAGRPQGRDQEYWEQAETQVTAEDGKGTHRNE
jgi:Protein of unknown function (DUF2934)